MSSPIRVPKVYLKNGNFPLDSFAIVLRLQRMATSVITTCDFQSHGVPAHTRIEITLEGKKFEADLCDGCIPELERSLLGLGLRPSIALVDGKPRGQYLTESGIPFTTAEAREWLVANGYDVHPTVGRVSAEMLREYAAAH